MWWLASVNMFMLRGISVYIYYVVYGGFCFFSVYFSINRI